MSVVRPFLSAASPRSRRRFSGFAERVASLGDVGRNLLELYLPRSERPRKHAKVLGRPSPKKEGGTQAHSCRSLSLSLNLEFGVCVCVLRAVSVACRSSPYSIS